MARFLLLLLVLSLFSCNKAEEPEAQGPDTPQEPEEVTDLRDTIIGQFDGISVFTTWTGSGYYHDTTDVEMEIAKEERDSVVVFTVDPELTNNAGTFLFRFDGLEFKPIERFHLPELQLHQDSLYFFWTNTEGPDWWKCYGHKRM